MIRWFREVFLPYLLVVPALLLAVLTVPLLWSVMKTRQAIRGR